MGAGDGRPGDMGFVAGAQVIVPLVAAAMVLIRNYILAPREGGRMPVV